jgi:hypothetical protein
MREKKIMPGEEGAARAQGAGEAAGAGARLPGAEAGGRHAAAHAGAGARAGGRRPLPRRPAAPPPSSRPTTLLVGNFASAESKLELVIQFATTVRPTLSFFVSNDGRAVPCVCSKNSGT